jgi:5-methylcytosine-specific restriction endonuclease McrA
MKVNRQKVYEKYGGCCGYCGKSLEIKEMQVDHISPKWSAKDNSVFEFENLMPTCRRCNHYKREKNLEQFREYMMKLHERIKNDYICKVGIDYGIIIVHPFDGLFYFEKQII